MPPHKNYADRIKLYDIIYIEKGNAFQKDGKINHVVAEAFKIMRSDVEVIIGEPINHTDFIKNKSNPKGSNVIPEKIKGKLSSD